MTKLAASQLFEIALGTSCFETNWQTKFVSWADFIDMLQACRQTPETMAEYDAMSKEQRAAAKNGKAYVGGRVNGQRKKDTIENRWLITLDADYADEDFVDKVSTAWGNIAYAVHTTHSHRDTAMKYRLILLCDRALSVREYDVIAQVIAEKIGIHYFDKTTFAVERLMYFPSCSIDAYPEIHVSTGAPLEVEKFMFTNNLQPDVKYRPQNLSNPAEKPGIIGKFCKQYSISTGITAFLSDVYKPTRQKDRYTYTGGTTAGGLQVYDDAWAYSYHSTDPASNGHCFNIFDLVRKHKFGHLDNGGSDYNSFREMCKLVQGDPSTRNLTESGNAEFLVDLCGDKIRYNYTLDSWLVWNGQCWQMNAQDEIERLSLEVVRQLPQTSKETTRWAAQSESLARRHAMMRLAQSIVPIPVRLSELDSPEYLFNVQNGTIDLRTGELLAHRKTDMLTKVAPVIYHAGAKSDLWITFLQRVLPDVETRNFVQRAAGYSMLGHAREEKLFFAYGPPATGKSTFLRAVQTTLGDYSISSDFELFLRRPASAGGPRPEILRLIGRRMVVSVEVDEGRSMAEALVSQLTGGDTIAARGMYQKNSEEFLPIFKLWLAANRRPRVSDANSPLWRRILQIPFMQRILEHEQNSNIKEQLTNVTISGSAILAWLVEGCMMYQKIGLNPPEAVRTLTANYQQESDPMFEFFEECCGFDPERETDKNALYNAYVAWYERSGSQRNMMLTKKKFAALMPADKVKETRRSYGNRPYVWTGIYLYDDPAYQKPIPF